MWCVILQPKGTSRNALLPPDQKELLSATAVGGILRRATAPEVIGTYKWSGTLLHLFGYKTGKAGTENKHELPPPHDKIMVFGDIVVIATKGPLNLVTFATADFQKFHTQCIGGLEDNGSQDSDTDEDEEEELEDEEGEEEAEEEVVEESEEESVAPIEAEEEEEAPRPPVRKPSAATIKRNNKKLPAWYVHTQLLSEKYESPQTKLHEMRQKIKTIIKSRCAFLTESDQADLERGIYNFTIDDSKRRIVHSVWENPEFTQLYLIHARRTIANLDSSSYINNARLIERFRDGEFRPHEIPFMNYSDLFPEKWGAMIELAIKREAKMLEVDKSMATDMFKCSRCGKRQCTYYEMQTRSADEPMTQFIRCMNCGKQWRQ
jgi:DNA-directed RNA polymerase subunit M/transcription elongation factor TFIIS